MLAVAECPTVHTVIFNTLMQAVNVNLTSTIFSTVGAQKAAKAAGYEENFSIDYEEFEHLIPGSNFSHVHGNCCKILSMKI
jgi:hypothetical protein